TGIADAHSLPPCQWLSSASITGVPFGKMVGGESGVGQWRQFFSLQIVLPVYADEVLVGNRNELTIATIRAESGPLPVSTDLLIADPALATDAVTPAAHNNYLITYCEVGRWGRPGADLFHGTGYLVPRNRRKC